MDLISQPFDGFISSPECDQLTNFITPQIKENLKLQRFSKTHYQYHLSRILLNLYQAWSSHPDKCVGISRRKNYYDSLEDMYRNRKLSYTSMTKSLDTLNELGYLDLVLLGERDPYLDTSFTSRYRATKTLTKLFTEYGFNQQSIIKDKTAVAVRLRGKKPKRTKKNKNPRGKLISYSPTKQTRLMTKNLKLINEVLENTEINLYLSNREMTALNKQMKSKHLEDPNDLPDINFSRKWLYRVFNEDFKRGGRFYGGFWQEIPSMYRSRLTIDHCVTWEIDFDSLHPAMLYLKEGYKKEDYLDPYQLTKFIGQKSYDSVKIPRKAIKVALNTMLNTKSYKEALGSVESSGLKPPKKYNDWKGVLKAIEQYHEPIAHHFYKAVGNELQAVDSQIVEMVLLELIKENTIALPVHDSFRYKVKDMQLLIKKMNVATKHYLGSELFITLEHQALNEPPKALTTSNSNYYSRRNNFLKRFNKVEEPFEPHLL